MSELLFSKHGGDFWNAVGPEFESLGRLRQVISADVLDAWFPPAPAVIEGLRNNVELLTSVSPPTRGEGLTRHLSERRGVPVENLIPGAGSSALIFLALREWVHQRSRCLLFEPAYGEYEFVLENLIGCKIEREWAKPEHNFQPDLGRLAKTVRGDYDWIFLVNPNSPTGRHVPVRELESILRESHLRTKIWIDETYVEYAGPEQSLEKFAATRPNVVICKSMSKVYALSGMRIGYLVAPPEMASIVSKWIPPWAVSLMGQVAAILALDSDSYYQARWSETAKLRGEIATGLNSLGFQTISGTANFVMARLGEGMPAAETLYEKCAESGLFIRTFEGELSDYVRVAVKDADAISRMITILGEAIRQS